VGINAVPRELASYVREHDHTVTSQERRVGSWLLKDQAIGFAVARVCADGALKKVTIRGDW